MKIFTKSLQKIIFSFLMMAAIQLPAQWYELITTTTGTPRCIEFYDTQNGLLGRDGIYKTTDGGQNWTSVLGWNGLVIYDIVYLSETIVVASGYNSLGNGVLVRSIDGGSTWSLSETSLDPFYQMDFFNENIGITISDFSVYHTTDGGENWFPFGTFNNGTIRELICDEERAYIATSTGLFVSEDQGYAWTSLIGNKDVRDICFTPLNHIGLLILDNNSVKLGLSYEDAYSFDFSVIPTNPFPNNNSNPFGQMTAVNEGTFIFSSMSKLMVTTDSGETWGQYGGANPYNIRDFYVFEDNSIAAVSLGCTNCEKIFKTDNYLNGINPIAYLLEYPEELCINATGNLAAFCGIEADSIHWVVNNQIIGTGCETEVSFSDDGIYTVELIVYSGTETTTAEVDVTVVNQPTLLPFSVELGEEIYCPQAYPLLTFNSPSTNVIYNIYADGEFHESFQYVNNINSTYIGRFYHDVEIVVVAQSSNSCIVAALSDTVQFVTYFPVEDQPEVLLSAEALCDSLTVTFPNPCEGCVITAQTGVNIFDDQTASGDTLSFTYYYGGYHQTSYIDLELEVATPTCGTFSLPPVVTFPWEGPEASFNLSDYVYDIGQPLQIEESSYYTAHIEWLNQDNLAIEDPLSVTPGISMTAASWAIPITLVAFSEHNCSDTTTQFVYAGSEVPELNGQVCWSHVREEMGRNVPSMTTDFYGNTYYATYNLSTLFPHDYWPTITKLDSNGNTVWTYEVEEVNNSGNNPGIAIIYKIVANSLGEVFAIGSVRGSADLGGYSVSGPDDQAGFFLKINSDGTFAWARTMQYTLATDLFLENDESLIIAFETRSNQTIQFLNEPLTTSSGILLARITNNAVLLDYSFNTVNCEGSGVSIENCYGGYAGLGHAVTPKILCVNDNFIYLCLVVDDNFTFNGELFEVTTNYEGPLVGLKYDKQTLDELDVFPIISTFYQFTTGTCYKHDPGVVTSSDQEGNFYIATQVYDYSTPAVFNGSIEFSEPDEITLLAKYNAAGELMWVIDNLIFMPVNIHVLSDGNIVVLGNAWNDLLIKDSSNEILHSESNQFDFFIALFSPDGSLISIEHPTGVSQQMLLSSTQYLDEILFSMDCIAGSINMDNNDYADKYTLKYSTEFNCSEGNQANLALEEPYNTMCEPDNLVIEWLATSDVETVDLAYSLDGESYQVFASQIDAASGSYSTSDLASLFPADALHIKISGSPQNLVDAAVYQLQYYEEPELADTLISCQSVTTLIDLPESFINVQWSNGVILPDLYVTQSGNYAITYTDENNCFRQHSFYVNINPMPNTTVTSTDDIICEGETLVLSVTPGYSSYDWTNGSNTNTTTVTSPGIYICEITNEFNCSTTEKIIVEACIAIGEYDLSQLLIYPNPFKDVVTIGNLQHRNMEFSVFDTSGKLVSQTQSISKNEMTIPLGDLAQGTYMLQITSDGFVRNIPLMKE